MASIYELTESMKTIWSLMEDGVLEDAVLEEIFADTTEELSIKLEGYCKFIRNLESDIAGLKEEEKRLSNKRKAMENTVERSKVAMLKALTIAGEKKMNCGSFTVSIQKNPDKVVLDESYIENIPEKYLKVADPEVNRTLLKEDLKNGVDLTGIAHLEQSEGLRIK